MATRKGRVHTKAIEIRDLAEASGVTPGEARKVLETAVREISDGDLTNFRGGQILLIK
jgi:DNA-directed RNA polymerase subunit K/omega